MANEEHVKILEDGVEAWNEWREKNPEEPDLTGAYLKDANLTGADFRDADLSRAYLSRAYLEDANFQGGMLVEIDLREACLVNADLSHANLTGANLREADFWVADLRGANLTYADLKGVNLNGADFGWSMGAVDLSEIEGLEEVNHYAPSTIGIDTLYASKGKIPEVFLRGCGVDADFIEHTQGLFGKAIEFYSCFISYSHADQSFARRLHDQLQGRGIDCWRDEHQLLPGDDVSDSIAKGIRIWDKVLLCCSEASLKSWWVHDEIDKALERERELFKNRGEKVLKIIPLNLDDFLFEGWQDGRASEIRKRLAANFVGWEHDNKIFEAQFDSVVKALRTIRAEPPEPNL